MSRCKQTVLPRNRVRRLRAFQNEDDALLRARNTVNWIDSESTYLLGERSFRLPQRLETYTSRGCTRSTLSRNRTGLPSTIRSTRFYKESIHRGSSVGQPRCNDPSPFDTRFIVRFFHSLESALRFRGVSLRRVINLFVGGTDPVDYRYGFPSDYRRSAQMETFASIRKWERSIGSDRIGAPIRIEGLRRFGRDSFSAGCYRCCSKAASFGPNHDLL